MGRPKRKAANPPKATKRTGNTPHLPPQDDSHADSSSSGDAGNKSAVKYPKSSGQSVSAGDQAPASSGAKRRKVSDEVNDIVQALLPAITESVVTALDLFTNKLSVTPANQASGDSESSTVHGLICENPVSQSSSLNALGSSPNTPPSQAVSTASPASSEGRHQPLPNQGVKNWTDCCVASRPLGLGVNAKIKGKIWSDQYVDFAVLLQDRDVDKLELTESDSGTLMFRKSAPAQIKTMDRWFRAFHVFAGVLTERHPLIGPDLMLYASTIHNLSSKAGEASALFYDKQFRLLRESFGATLSFGQTHFATYNEALAMGLCRSSGGFNQSFRRNESAGICNAFNNFRCTRPICIYQHVCQICRGQHGRRVCPKNGNKSLSGQGQLKSIANK